MIISIFEKAGSFAENKDIAKTIRVKELQPLLEKDTQVILDFENVEAATQSFIHALISDLIWKFGNKALDLISFKSCNETVKKLITIVIEYTQEGMDINGN